MTAFYFAAAILAAIALVMLLRPLRAKQQRIAEAAAETNVVLEANNAIYRAQLAELDRDHAIGQISDADYAEAHTELQRRLLEDAASASGETETRKPAVDIARRTRIGLAFFLPLCALGIYSQIGNPVAALSPTEQAQHADLTMDKMIVQLRAKLDAKPDNPEGWAMLAQSYGALGRWDDAAQAFTRIGPTLAQDPRLLAAFAEVLARQAGGSFEGKPRTLIGLALKLDPSNPYALMLAGSDAFQNQRWSEVPGYWEPLLAQVEPDSEDAKSLEEGIAKAREMSGAKSPVKVAKTPVGAGNTPSKMPSKQGDIAATAVSGRVELAAALKAQTRPDDTVFIFARAVSEDGSPASRMPLAIQRARVADLPIDFVLDDSSAMTPQTKISGAKLVRIEARISRSGNAIAASGDIAGQSEVIKPGAKKLQITLDRLVP